MFDGNLERACIVRMLLPVASILLLCSCGVPTYVRPNTPDQSASASVQGTQAQILDAAVKTLVQDGYEVTTVDNASGLISTAPRAMQVTPEQADCGKVQGSLASGDPLTYPRPMTRVAFDILAADNHLEVRSRIDDSIDDGRGPTNLTCVSRGVLDRQMLDQIKARL